jgi:hypothetical protein
MQFRTIQAFKRRDERSGDGKEGSQAKFHQQERGRGERVRGGREWSRKEDREEGRRLDMVGAGNWKC